MAVTFSIREMVVEGQLAGVHPGDPRELVRALLGAPDDIRYVAYPVLNHRIILTPEREMEGFATKDVIKDILGKIEVPR